MDSQPKRCISFLVSPKERCRETTPKRFCGAHLKKFGVPKYKKIDDINISNVHLVDLGAHRLLTLYKKIQNIVTLRQAFMEKAVCEECRDSGHLLRIKLLLDIQERCDEILESLFKPDEIVDVSPDPEIPKVKLRLAQARVKFVATKKKIEEWESLAASMIKENDHIIATLEEEATLFVSINQGRLSQVYVLGHLYNSIALGWKRKEVIRWYQKPTIEALSHQEKYQILRVGIFHMGVSHKELMWNMDAVKAHYSFESKVQALNLFVNLRLQLASDILGSIRTLILAKYSYDTEGALSRKVIIICLGKDWSKTYSLLIYEKLAAFDLVWEDSHPLVTLEEVFQGQSPLTPADFSSKRQYKEWNITFAVNKMMSKLTNDNADELVSKLEILINS